MDLLDNFINSLHEKITKRSELVIYISDALSIEKESANRRLNRKVQFTIQEMGKLSKKLGISVDNLIHNKKENVLPGLTMKLPMSGHFDDLVNSMQSSAQKLEEICDESVEYGTAFSSLPVEFFHPYPSLEKFMFFKWGHFHVGSNEFNKFGLWEIPDKLQKINQQLERVNDKIKNRIYIWNPVTIWNMAKEIKYFKSINAISDDEAHLIKTDLCKMLDYIENQAKMREIPPGNKIKIYVSFINHGLNFCYFNAVNNFYVTFGDYFVSMDYYEDRASFIHIQEWITSMKRVSALISESGTVERRLFFEEQYNYINQI